MTKETKRDLLILGVLLFLLVGLSALSGCAGFEQEYKNMF